MRTYILILPLLVLLYACHPSQSDDPTIDGILVGYDSIYTTADIQWHGQYYPLLDRQVFSIDLFGQGLSLDSANYIVGTGYNLYLSDVFLPLTDTSLQAGVYHMVTTSEAYTFLPYKNFDGNVTGSYLLEIQNNNINRIIGFTSGEMRVTYLSEKDIRLDMMLYTADSIRYRAIYQGPAFAND